MGVNMVLHLMLIIISTLQVSLDPYYKVQPKMSFVLFFSQKCL